MLFTNYKVELLKEERAELIERLEEIMPYCGSDSFFLDFNKEKQRILDRLFILHDEIEMVEMIHFDYLKSL